MNEFIIGALIVTAFLGVVYNLARKNKGSSGNGGTRPGTPPTNSKEK